MDILRICCKNGVVCLKRLKINEKEAGNGPFFKVTFKKKNLNGGLTKASFSYCHLYLDRRASNSWRRIGIPKS